MSFDYVWGISRVLGQPPRGEKFHAHQGEYRYYPFFHQGPIFTADCSLWEFGAATNSFADSTEIAYWPREDEIAKFVEEEPNRWLVAILTDKPQAQTIDPAGPVGLSRIPSTSKKTFITEFSIYGYDVVDISGLSALVNVGYTACDLAALKGTPIEINEHGLISTANDGYLFAEFASHAAPEHAPFFPVELWAKPRRQKF